MSFFISYPCSPRSYIIPWAYRLSGWYHDLGLIKGMVWKMSCNNLYLLNDQSSHTFTKNQLLLILPEQIKSPPVLSGVRVTRSLVLCVCFVDRYFSFCSFPLAIVLSVLLRFTDSDYPFGIFKLFLLKPEMPDYWMANLIIPSQRTLLFCHDWVYCICNCIYKGIQ
jgi:hypothetical protein